MKPSWDDAPEWARWLGCDLGGSWRWYEKKPVWAKYLGWSSDGREAWAEDSSVGDLYERT